MRAVKGCSEWVVHEWIAWSRRGDGETIYRTRCEPRMYSTESYLREPTAVDKLCQECEKAIGLKGDRNAQEA